MSSTRFDSRESLIGSPQDILARLERYAAMRRAESGRASVAHTAPSAAVRVALAPATPDPSRVRHALRLWLLRRDVDASSVDLFPYDITASIVGCTATILAYISFGRPVAVMFSVGLGVVGEWARRARWFPSAGVNLILGTLVGVLLVFTA